MAADYFVKFKEVVEFKNENKKLFSFNRGLSQFIGNHLNNPESLLEKVESRTNVELQFITLPDLYNYEVDEFRLEFAEGEEREKILKDHKRLNKESHKAWYSIKEFIVKLDTAISKLENSDKIGLVDYDRNWWMNYLDNGDLIKDLRAVNNLLKQAEDQNQELFTYILG